MSGLTEAKKQLRKAQQESLKRAFETLWQQLGGPELIPEFRFHSSRLWRFDYVTPPEFGLNAIELEGGTFSGGAHVRGKGYSKDCQKYNEAQLLGYRVYRFTSDMLTQKEAPAHLQPIIEAIKAV